MFYINSLPCMTTFSFYQNKLQTCIFYAHHFALDLHRKHTCENYLEKSKEYREDIKTVDITLDMFVTWGYFNKL